MGVTVQTKYAIGDSVAVKKYEEKFNAVIDTVSVMLFELSNGDIVTDISYIGVDKFGNRKVFNESECKLV